MYLSLTPTSMQFMPISPSPPIGSTRSGGPLAGGGPGNGLQSTQVRMFCEKQFFGFVVHVMDTHHSNGPVEGGGPGNRPAEKKRTTRNTHSHTLC